MLKLVGNHTSLPDYFLLTNLEQIFDPDVSHAWIERNWIISFYISIVYLICVYGGVKFMADKKPFKIRKPLMAWNMILSAVSLLCCIRLSHHSLHVLANYGVYGAFCENRIMKNDVVLVFWITVYTSLKALELGDTAFIVLRKTPLIFLHWYHHVTSLVYVMFSVQQAASFGRLFVVMNSFIHFLMYGYYAFRAMRYTLPKAVSITITLLQILQMLAAVYANYLSYYYLKTGTPCGVTWTNIYWSLIMYFSYFALFCKFFYNTYIEKVSKGRTKIKGILKQHYS